MRAREFKFFIALSLLAMLVSYGLLVVLKRPSSDVIIDYVELSDSLQTVVTELKIENGRNELIIDRIRDKDSLIVIEASKNLE